ncbi:hypothetical protein HDV64DRAFT_145919 [Trichoderma sp. TUCIM 5745]
MMMGINKYKGHLLVPRHFFLVLRSNKCWAFLVHCCIPFFPSPFFEVCSFCLIAWCLTALLTSFFCPTFLFTSFYSLSLFFSLPLLSTFWHPEQKLA